MPSSPAYSAVGLPTGLSIAPVTGLIPGTPTTAGAFTPAVSIENSAAVDLVHDRIGGQVISRVSEDGIALLVKDFVRDAGTELHATCTVDASALPADDTQRLRVTDDTPGIFTVAPGYPDSRSLTFRPS
ncbi:putative Ig domain-containing protein [Streptomyces sp. NPDC020794]|uniref:putative Ig domain-containing protein n=1 Tax=unclassified Streptomyces TaxID=2593676 RepID=UPI0036E318EA